LSATIKMRAIVSLRLLAPHAIALANVRIEVPVSVQFSARMSRSEEHSATRLPTPLHIDRAAGPEIDLTTIGYSVAFGGSKDAVGTILLGTPAGLDALTAFLRKIGLASSEIEIARRALSEQPHHELPDMKLSPTTLQQLGEPGTAR